MQLTALYPGFTPAVIEQLTLVQTLAYLERSPRDERRLRLSPVEAKRYAERVRFEREQWIDRQLAAVAGASTEEPRHE